MDTRIEELANIIIERCQQMTDDHPNVIQLNSDRHRAYLYIMSNAFTIKGHIDAYRAAHPELYKD